MSELWWLQTQFASMVPRLIDFAIASGYYVTIGHCTRCADCKTGHTNSLHKKRLAIDLNLFSQEGEYLQTSEPHKKLHEYWESLGGAPMIAGDANHYSVEYKGMR